MKSVRSVINKNLKMLLIVAVVTAIALGALLLLITGNQERDQVAVEPPSAASESESTEAETETSTEEAQSTQANISQRAQNLFAAKVPLHRFTHSTFKGFLRQPAKFTLSHNEITLEGKESAR